MGPGALTWIVASWALSAPQVAAAPDCPDAAAITRAEAQLAFPPAADPHLVTLQKQGDKLRLTLRDQAAQVLGERDLELSASCEELASAIALVLLFWENDPPGPDLPAPLLPAPPTDTTLVRSDTPDTGAAKPPPPTSGGLSPAHLALGFGPLGSVDSAGAAIGGTLYGVVTDVDRRYGFALAIGGASNRQLTTSFPGVSVSYSRFPIDLGGLWQFHFAKLTATAELDAATDVIEAQSHGLATACASCVDTTKLSIKDVGLRVGGRVSYSLGDRGRVRPWLGVYGSLWSPVELFATTSAAPIGPPPLTLPQEELLFSGGVELEVF